MCIDRKNTENAKFGSHKNYENSEPKFYYKDSKIQDRINKEK